MKFDGVLLFLILCMPLGVICYMMWRSLWNDFKLSNLLYEDEELL